MVYCFNLEKNRVIVSVKDIEEAYKRIQEVVNETPLLRDPVLSKRYQANILLKREDLQIVRSYKLRGAYNKMAGLTPGQRANGILCASTG